VALNGGFVVVEVIYGLLGHSVALLADAGHNLGDVLGLLVAWVASVLVRRAPTLRFTYGLRGSSILAALFNAVFLLVVVGGISWEAIQRFGHPEPVAGLTVIVVAAVGIVVNGVTACLFAAGRKGDLNLRGAFLHMLSDAVVSAGVVVAGVVILLTAWLWLALMSLVVSAVIIWGTWSLLRDSLTMSLAAVPPGIDPAAVLGCLESQPGVTSVHDLHIWPMSTTETALTAHLVIPAGLPENGFLPRLAAKLEDDFGICHTTIQLESGPAEACALANSETV
jgi:cobalt-zinc-cadmium efflux system protein